MRSFNALDPAEHLIAPHFLEASAGTGKTFAIEHIVVRLLLDEDLLAKGDEILVVTFTRAATRELKMRIRYNLQKALDSLKCEQGKPFLPYLEVIAKTPEKRSRAISKLQEALYCFDQMQIFTIHGFCQQMLKAYPFDAGISLQKAVSEGLGYRNIAKEQILDFLRTGLTPSLFHKCQIEKVFRKNLCLLDKVVDKIFSLINKDTTFPSFLSYEECLELFKKNIFELKKEVSCNFKELLEQFLCLAPLFKGLTTIKKELHPHFLEQVKIFIECFENKDKIQNGFDQLLSYDAFFWEHLTEGSLKKNAKATFSSLKENIIFFSFKEKMEQPLLEGTEQIKILLRMAALCKERIDKALTYYDVTQPNDLLKVMQKSLMNTSFCAKIQGKYKAAIVDEFQDTDPLQWEIFHTLFFHHRNTFPLFLVGDPKQSIYAFRNADLPTYLQASKVFSAEQHLSLDVNYRSEPQLIETLNALFLALPKWLSEEEQLIYKKVKANPEAIDTDFGDGYGSVHIFSTEEDGKEKHIPSKHVEEGLLFPFVAREVLKLRRLGMNLKNMVILIRDRFQGERLETYLKKIKISYMATSSVNLVDTASFYFLKTLIKMMGANVVNLSLIKELLAHPIMGCCHRDLRVDQKNEKILKALIKMKELSKLYLEEGFLVFWEKFVQTSFYDEKYTFEERLLQNNMFQDYQDLNQLADLLSEEHNYVRLSHEELMSVLVELEEADPEEKENLKRRAFSEEDAITIMTMHKSKGLEFDVVFALGLCIRSSSQEEVIKSKEGLEVFDSHNPLHQDILRQTNQEKLRQLYVALTRAKKRVYIPMVFHKNKEPSFEGALSPIELLIKQICPDFLSQKEVFKSLGSLRIKGLSFGDLNEENIVIESEQKEEMPMLCLPLMYLKEHKQKYMSSYSSLAGQEIVRSRNERIAEPIALPASADTGNLLHKILEKIFERGLYISFDRKVITLLVTQEIMISHLNGCEEEVVNILERVMQIHFQEGDNSFFFKDIRPSEMFTEMEFFLEDSVLFKGFIDLLFHYKDRYYLLDWKSNFLGSSTENYDPVAIKGCMEENGYFIQAKLYTNALKTYLKQLGKTEESYGGIFYVFLRGLEPGTAKGTYHIR